MDIKTPETTQYTDFNSNTHSVSHKILPHDEDTMQLTERIIEDICNVFSSKQ